MKLSALYCVSKFNLTTVNQTRLQINNENEQKRLRNCGTIPVLDKTNDNA